MPWPFLSPRRFEILTALALLVTGRESLPDGLEGLAGNDPLLRPWARRLAAPLRAGERLCVVLRAQRLVSVDESALLAGAEAAGDAASVARVLAAIALEARAPARGYRFIRWFPFWLGCVALLPSFLLVLTVEAATGQRYHAFGATIVSPFLMSRRGFFDEYPSTPLALFDPSSDSLALCLGEASALVLGCLALACWLLPRIRGARAARLALCPDAHRSALALALVRHARATPDFDPPVTSVDRWLGRLWLAARAPGATAWAADWRDWSLLSWFRGSPDAYLHAAGGDLATALDGMGLVPIQPGGARDWNTAERLALERHQRVVAGAGPLLGLVAAVVGLICFAGLTLELGFHWSMLDLFVPLHVDESRASVAAVAGFALAVIGQALIAVMILQGLWTVVRLAIPGMGPTRIVCARVAEALRRGEDVSGALNAAALTLPMPYPGRIARALERIDGGEPSLVESLRKEWVLPGRLEREGLAAESLGREALADWFAERAGPVEPGSDRWRVALPALLTTVAVVGSGAVYMSIGILPKFEKMLQYSHEQTPPLLRLMLYGAKLGNPPTWSILSIPILIMVLALTWCAYQCGWLPGQHAERRLGRGRLVSRAASSGIPESEIAVALAASFAWPSRALRLAGEAGDLGGIMRACGWRVGDRAGLATAIVHCERRRATRRAWLTTAIMILAPAVLAIPILLMGGGIFQVQAVFIRRMNDQAGSVRAQVPDFVPASLTTPVPNTPDDAAPPATSSTALATPEATDARR